MLCHRSRSDLGPESGEVSDRLTESAATADPQQRATAQPAASGARFVTEDREEHSPVSEQAFRLTGEKPQFPSLEPDPAPNSRGSVGQVDVDAEASAGTESRRR